MNKIKLKYMHKEFLTLKDCMKIKELENISNDYDKSSLKLELDYKLMVAKEEVKSTRKNEFFCYFENQLIAYAGICDFGGETIEVTGMVHPKYRRKGIFTYLLTSIKSELAERHNDKILLLCDADSTNGQSFIKQQKVKFDHAEFEMHIKDHEKVEKNIVGKSLEINLRKATNKDTDEIAYQNKIYFSDEQSRIEVDEEEQVNTELDSTSYETYKMIPEDEEKNGVIIYIAELKGKVIGKVHLQISNGLGGIYGLGVIPKYRNSGYGRQILNLAVRELQRVKCEDIMLQVELQNKHALKLYHSCGFEERSVMEYYELLI